VFEDDDSFEDSNKDRDRTVASGTVGSNDGGDHGHD